VIEGGVQRVIDGATNIRGRPTGQGRRLGPRGTSRRWRDAQGDHVSNSADSWPALPCPQPQQTNQPALELLMPVAPGTHFCENAWQGRRGNGPYSRPDGADIQLLEHRPCGCRKHSTKDHDHRHSPSTVRRRRLSQLNPWRGVSGTHARIVPRGLQPVHLPGRG
jgi:hypothetical protein